MPSLAEESGRRLALLSATRSGIPKAKALSAPFEGISPFEESQRGINRGVQVPQFMLLLYNIYCNYLCRESLTHRQIRHRPGRAKLNSSREVTNTLHAQHDRARLPNVSHHYRFRCGSAGAMVPASYSPAPADARSVDGRAVFRARAGSDAVGLSLQRTNLEAAGWPAF